MLEIIFFGILQGLFEWLPISSQGNLILIMVGILGYSPERAIELSIFLHLGTLLVVLVYFRKEIRQLFSQLREPSVSEVKREEETKPLRLPERGVSQAKGEDETKSHRLKNYCFIDFQKSQESKIISFIIISSIITGLIGLPLFLFLIVPVFAGEVLVALIGISLIITGIFQKLALSKELKTIENLGLKDSILLGIVQGFSIIPGISRSGITISAFLLRSYKAETALKLSFLMSIPAVIMAQIGLILFQGLPALTIGQGILGIFFAFLSGMLSIHIFLKIARRVKFWLFCIIIGIIALAPLLFYL